MNRYWRKAKAVIFNIFIGMMIMLGIIMYGIWCLFYSV